MSSPHLESLLLLVVTPAAFLAAASARRLAALAVVMLALAAGSLRVAPGATPLAELARRASEFGLSPEALVVDGGFLVAGLLLAGAAAVVAWRAAASLPARAAAVGLLLGLLVLAAGVAPLLWLAGPARSTLAALVLLGAGWLAGRGARALGLGAFARRLTRPLAPRVPAAASAASAGGRRWMAALAAASLLTALLPTLWTVVLAAAAAAFAAERVARARGTAARWPIVAVAVVLVVAGAGALMVVSGERDPRIAALPDAPFSTAAEYLLAPALLASLWGFTGLAPFTRLVPGAMLAPAGLAVLARVVLGAVPDGVDHWRPIVWLVVVAAIGVAALQGRRDLLLVGAATLALTSASTEGLASALFLGAGAVLALAVPAAWAGRVPLVRPLGWALAGWGGVLALQGALAREVVLTLLATAAVAAAIASGGEAAAPGASIDHPIG